MVLILCRNAHWMYWGVPRASGQSGKVLLGALAESHRAQSWPSRWLEHPAWLPVCRQHTALPGLRGQQWGNGARDGVQLSTSERTALGHEGHPLETQLTTPLGHWTLVWGQAKQDTPVLWAETHPALNTSGLCLEHGWEQGEEESCSWLVDRGQLSCFQGRLELLPFLPTNTEMQWTAWLTLSLTLKWQKEMKKECKSTPVCVSLLMFSVKQNLEKQSELDNVITIPC